MLGTETQESQLSVTVRAALSAIKAHEETTNNCCKKQLSSIGTQLYPSATELKECYGKRMKRNRLTRRALKVSSHAVWSLSKKVKVATVQEEPWPGVVLLLAGVMPSSSRGKEIVPAFRLGAEDKGQPAQEAVRGQEGSESSRT